MRTGSGVRGRLRCGVTTSGSVGHRCRCRSLVAGSFTVEVPIHLQDTCTEIREELKKARTHIQTVGRATFALKLNKSCISIERKGRVCEG